MKNVLSLQRLALSSGAQGHALLTYSWATNGCDFGPQKPQEPLTMSWATNGCMD